MTSFICFLTLVSIFSAFVATRALPIGALRRLRGPSLILCASRDEDQGAVGIMNVFRKQLMAKDTQIAAKDTQIAAKDRQLEMLLVLLLKQGRQLERLLSEKDRQLAEKDRQLSEKDRQLERQLDWQLERLLSEKHAWTQNKDDTIEVQKKLIEEKYDTIEVQKKLIEEKEKELLAVQGLLTSRGVIEHFAQSYLEPLVRGNKQRMTVSAVLSGAGALAYKKEPKSDKKDIKLLRSIYESCIADASKHNSSDCSEFYRDLYVELSKEIHGSPWRGPGVKNTILNVPNAAKYICVVRGVCERLNLELVE